MKKCIKCFLVMLVGSWLGLNVLAMETNTDNIHTKSIVEKKPVSPLQTHYSMVISMILKKKKIKKLPDILCIILPYLLPVFPSKPILEVTSNRRKYISALLLSPDERFLFSGGDHLKIWDYACGDCLNIQGENNWSPINSLALDEEILLTGHEDTTMIIWRVHVTPFDKSYMVTLDVLQTVQYSTNSPGDYCFLDHQRILLGKNLNIKVWDWETGTMLQRMQVAHLENTVYSFTHVFTTKHGCIATQSNFILDIDINQHGLTNVRRTARVRMNSIMSSCITADGKYVFVGGGGGKLEIYRLDLPEIMYVIGWNYGMSFTAWIHKIELWTEDHLIVIGNYKGELEVWEWQPKNNTMKQRYTISGVSSGVYAKHCFGSQGEIIIATGKDGEMTMWNIHTGALHKNEVLN